MGEKTGVLMMIIATLVVGALFLAINKGFTSEVSEEVGTKMKSLSSLVKGEKDGENEKDEGGKGEVNTGSLVLKVPYDARMFYFSEVGEPIVEFSEILEHLKPSCEFFGEVDACFDVLEFDEKTGEYKSLGEEAINEIKMDTSQVNINKEGYYPVFLSYEDKETGDIYKVASTYKVYDYVNNEKGFIWFKDDGIYRLDTYGGKSRLITENGEEILFEGGFPTLQELRDNGLLSMMGFYYEDIDTDEDKYLDGTEEGIEIDVPYFDKNVPGLYPYVISYTDSDTGNIYEHTLEFWYYFNIEDGRHSSDSVTRK